MREPTPLERAAIAYVESLTHPDRNEEDKRRAMLALAVSDWRRANG